MQPCQTSSVKVYYSINSASSIMLLCTCRIMQLFGLEPGELKPPPRPFSSQQDPAVLSAVNAAFVTSSSFYDILPSEVPSGLTLLEPHFRYGDKSFGTILPVVISLWCRFVPARKYRHYTDNRHYSACCHCPCFSHLCQATSHAL